MTLLTTYVWWAFQWPPMFAVSPVQTQPIGRAAGAAPFPDHWLVSFDTYEHYFVRHYVDHALIGGHVLYLVGLTVLCIGSALRSRRWPWVTEPRTALGRRLRWTGWSSVALGIVIQLWAIGFVFGPTGAGEGQIP